MAKHFVFSRYKINANESLQCTIAVVKVLVQQDTSCVVHWRRRSHVDVSILDRYVVEIVDTDMLRRLAQYSEIVEIVRCQDEQINVVVVVTLYRLLLQQIVNIRHTPTSSNPTIQKERVMSKMRIAILTQRQSILKIKRTFYIIIIRVKI